MATATSTTTNVLPAWYTQYATDLLGRAYQATGEPYQAYGAPRIAGFQPEQEQAFDITRGGIGSYKPYVTAATEATGAGTTGSGLSAASPFFARAGESFADNAGRYMNPYTKLVVDQIGQAARTNLTENLLPVVNRTFVGGGTFGGSRSADFTARAVRDANSAALAKQAEALQQGYAQAGDIFGKEAARFGDIGTSVGKIAESDYSRMLAGGQQFANLGAQQQEMSAADAAALAGVGAQRQGLAQRSADLAYQDFLEQRGYPLQMTKELSGIGSTLKTGTGTTSETTPGPSTLGQIIGGLGGIAGILGGAGIFKDGGEVEGPVTANGKRNIKHPMHGLGWLKDVK